MPDKKFINTAYPEERGSIEAEFVTDGEVEFTLCRSDGTAYGEHITQDTAPENPTNMTLWVDTSTTPHTMKQWSESSSMWVSIATTYIKILCSGIGKSFEQFDGITISGLTGQKEQIAALEGAAIIQDKKDDYIVVIGILDEATKIDVPVTITRKMPVMDFVVECNNRLWGCRYGMDDHGEFVNRLYASKLGDFKNWNCYQGISTDSYFANVGTDGAFTGAITHLGSALFFKETCLHKVYGSFPSEFQVQDTACRGVQFGCDRSLAIVNEVLYYKARHAVCSYDGSLPVEVSYALGSERYFDAVAGAYSNKYYISMCDKAGVWHLFVYDTSKGLWHREDNLHAEAFAELKGEMYCIDADDRNIITLLGSGDPDEAVVKWDVETGELGISSPDMKYISRITFRMSMEIGSEMDIYAQYDLSDEWEHVCHIRGTNLRSFSIPIRPRRCDFMRLKIKGKGGGKIYSMTKTIEQGSELS
jgi:ribosomal protein L15